MVFVKKSTFFLYVFFLPKKGRKKHFLIFWIENKAFWTSKVKFSQSRKKSTFCKGVSPWFLSKNRPFSHFFFLTKKSQKEILFHILDRKECFLDLKSEVLKNLKKWTFCRGLVHGFCQKINLSLICFFFVKKATKKHFLIFWIEKKRKEYFLDHKRKGLKNCKKSTFCKGVSPCFFQKIDLFLICFFF